MRQELLDLALGELPDQEAGALRARIEADPELAREYAELSSVLAVMSRGERIEPAETLIVGDSVLDVECARQSDMRCLAVATGYTPITDLERAEPDWVVGDLGEAAEVHPLFRS